MRPPPGHLVTRTHSNFHNRSAGAEDDGGTVKIRIRLKAYDHEAIDASARRIVETVTKTGARVVGPVPLPTEKTYAVIRRPHKYKDLVRALRDAHAQAAHRHPRPDAEDGGRTSRRIDLPASVDVNIQWGGQTADMASTLAVSSARSWG